MSVRGPKKRLSRKRSFPKESGFSEDRQKTLGKIPGPSGKRQEASSEVRLRVLLVSSGMPGPIVVATVPLSR